MCLSFFIMVISKFLSVSRMTIWVLFLSLLSTLRCIFARLCLKLWALCLLLCNYFFKSAKFDFNKCWCPRWLNSWGYIRYVCQLDTTFSWKIQLLLNYWSDFVDFFFRPRSLLFPWSELLREKFNPRLQKKVSFSSDARGFFLELLYLFSGF